MLRLNLSMHKEKERCLENLMIVAKSRLEKETKDINK